ncbi:MAG: hypothetical protein HC869_15200 [Rhodospirillales bacterium]|nr:hypothetical protein [Rhodospirillales bacterium]
MHTRLCGAVLTEFAVKNLGWVEIGTARNAMHVRCRPSMTSDCALAALLYHIWDHAHDTVVLTAWLDAWQHFILRDRQMFTRLLSSLIHGGRAPAFWSGHRLISRATDQVTSPFGEVAPIARAIGEGAALLQDVAPAFDALFRNRWSICEPDTARGHTVIRAIGRGYTPFNPRWFAQAKNTTLCAYADEDYGLWVARTHRFATQQRQPLFDEVDAIVTFPRIGETRLRYSRMTMPLVRPDGGRLVLTVALSDSAIDLRQSLSQVAR